jgi:hypothetical protein
MIVLYITWQVLIFPENLDNRGKPCKFSIVSGIVFWPEGMISLRMLEHSAILSGLNQ